MPVSARAVGALLAGGSAMAALAYSSFVEPRQLSFQRRAVIIPRLPLAFHGFTILHISDLHLGGTSWAADHVLSTASVSVDLVVATGDLIERRASAEACARLLGGLRAAHGVVCVLGNHDHREFRRDPRRARTFAHILKAHGVRTLFNESTVFERGEARLWLVGVDDPHHSRDDTEAAFSNVPADAPAVLLAHSPDVISSLRAGRADLVLTGHCHGGQVRTPWGPVYTRTRRRFPDVLGLQRVDGTLFHMSAGLGAGVPLRFLCPPGATVLHLSAG